MKKTVGILIILFMVIISLGGFFYSNGMFLNILTKDFNGKVNIVTKLETVDKTINQLQIKAKENNLSFIKVQLVPKDGEYGKSQWKMYIYLNESKWFKDIFKNISISESKNGLNAFKKANSVNFLTSKDIRLIPFEQIDREKINGDYYVRGSRENINKFAREIKENKELNTEIVVDNDVSVPSDFSQKEGIMYLMAVFIICVALIFCKIMYNGMISKELSISVLLGYSKVDLVLKKTINLIMIPTIVGFFLSIITVFYLAKSDNVFGFIVSAKPIFILIIIMVIGFILVEFGLLYIKLKGINVISWIKGYRSNYTKSSFIVKTGSIAMVLYLTVVSILGIGDYMDMRQYIKVWENTKNYGNIGFTWPNSYEEDDEKFQKVFASKMNALWDSLDDNGAILFNGPNIIAEDMDKDEEYLKKQPFKGNYGYVNKNYLKIANLVDERGNGLEKYNINNGEWIVFVPKSIEITQKDRAEIHKTHIFINVEQQEEVKETYVRIENNQRAFSFDSNKKIDEANLQNYILIAVNGKELASSHGIKLASLINGQLHPYIKNPNKPYESIKELVENTHTEPFVLDVNSLYDEIARKINFYRVEATINIAGLILSILILAVLLKIDREHYFYSHGQRIDVSRLLGYGFFEIHRKKIMKDIIVYIVSVISMLAFIRLTDTIIYLGLFEPRGGWNLSKLLLGLVIGTVVGTICFSLELVMLNRDEKQIITRLKEGC